MKKLLIAFATVLMTVPAFAQSESAKHEEPEAKSSSGDYFQGFSRTITYDRMIPPYGLEVTFYKTTHLIFPAPIVYVDLGSGDIIAGKADGAENVLRIKAAVRSFESETNLAVITEDGAYFSFNVRYADEPVKLSIEMADFTRDGEAVNRPDNSIDIYLAELRGESPRIVDLINRTIYRNDKRHIKNIGGKRFGVGFLLKGIYVHENLLYLHVQFENESNVPFDVDFMRMKIVDKRAAKRTAIQEITIHPVRVYNHIHHIGGKRTEHTVFTIDKITIPDGKHLVVELFEKNGGRHQKFIIRNADIIRAHAIDNLK